MRLQVVPAFALLAVSGLLARQTVTPLNIQTGLWQTTLKQTNHGSLGIPPEVAAQLSPMQRARAAAMLKAITPPPSQTYTRCVTQKDFNQDPFPDKSRQSYTQCTETVLSSSSSAAQIHEVCKGEVEVDATISYQASDPQHMAGTGHAVIAVGGQQMTTDSTLTSHWIGATCPKN
ncbi:MAG TPA: DUF3617 family protein [Terriglobales bacterium]|nr:DUF3617 family protein [Terriglobales bacterium]